MSAVVQTERRFYTGCAKLSHFRLRDQSDWSFATRLARNRRSW
jgi:hypothetical protein